MLRSYFPESRIPYDSQYLDTNKKKNFNQLEL